MIRASYTTTTSVMIGLRITRSQKRDSPADELRAAAAAAAGSVIVMLEYAAGWTVEAAVTLEAAEATEDEVGDVRAPELPVEVLNSRPVIIALVGEADEQAPVDDEMFVAADVGEEKPSLLDDVEL